MQNDSTSSQKLTMTPPIFIIGTHRSGTTLLCRMLTAHPRIFIKNELPHVCKIFSYSHSTDQVLAKIDIEMQKSYNSSLAAFLEKTDKQRWGVKSPNLTSCLGCILWHFPTAKILIIIRDGRAVASSYIKTKWGVATNIYSGAQRWKREMETQREFVKQNMDKCYMLKYEDLIQHPTEELRRICFFLGESYVDEMCHYEETVSYIQKTTLSQNVFQAIDQDTLMRWKKELSPFQINIFETIAGDILRQHRYPLFGKKIWMPKVLQWYYRLHQKILGELQLQYRLKLSRLREIKHLRERGTSLLQMESKTEQ